MSLDSFVAKALTYGRGGNTLLFYLETILLRLYRIFMQLKDGSSLQNGKYRIIRVLGQGGFGITYLAENIYFGKMVAIKEFFPKDFCGRDNTSHIVIRIQNNTETVNKLIYQGSLQP